MECLTQKVVVDSPLTQSSKSSHVVSKISTQAPIEIEQFNNESKSSNKMKPSGKPNFSTSENDRRKITTVWDSRGINIIKIIIREVMREETETIIIKGITKEDHREIIEVRTIIKKTYLTWMSTMDISKNVIDQSTTTNPLKASQTSALQLATLEQMLPLQMGGLTGKEKVGDKLTFDLKKIFTPTDGKPLMILKQTEKQTNNEDSFSLPLFSFVSLSTTESYLISGCSILGCLVPCLNLSVHECVVWL